MRVPVRRDKPRIYCVHSRILASLKVSTNLYCRITIFILKKKILANRHVAVNRLVVVVVFVIERFRLLGF